MAASAVRDPTTLALVRVPCLGGSCGQSHHDVRFSSRYFRDPCRALLRSRRGGHAAIATVGDQRNTGDNDNRQLNDNGDEHRTAFSHRGERCSFDAFIAKSETWQPEMTALRRILLGCDLTEELKWGKPCYTHQSTNLVLIVPLNEHCALLFSKGALLKDSQGVLTRPGEHSQSARWMKFSSLKEVTAMAANRIALEFISALAKKRLDGHPIRYDAASRG